MDFLARGCERPLPSHKIPVPSSDGVWLLTKAGPSPPKADNCHLFVEALMQVQPRTARAIYLIQVHSGTHTGLARASTDLSCLC